jgi:hypothetical protein
VCGAEYLFETESRFLNDFQSVIAGGGADESASDATSIAAFLDLSRPGMLALLAADGLATRKRCRS